MFISLKNILQPRMGEQGILKQAIIAQIVESLKNIVKKQWGDSAVAALRNVYLKEDTLHVQCSSSVMAQEIKLQETLILNELAIKFPKMVKRLRIYG